MDYREEDLVAALVRESSVFCDAPGARCAPGEAGEVVGVHLLTCKGGDVIAREEAGRLLVDRLIHREVFLREAFRLTRGFTGALPDARFAVVVATDLDDLRSSATTAILDEEGNVIALRLGCAARDLIPARGTRVFAPP